MVTVNEKTLMPLGVVIGACVVLVPVVFALGGRDAQQASLTTKVAEMEKDYKEDRKALAMQLEDIQKSIHELQWSAERIRETVDKREK